jgi:hypothetical protein
MNKKIIIILVIFLIISFFYLAYVEKKQADLNNKNFWVLYFSDPKSDNLDFVIENHSHNTNFHWEVLADENKINSGDITIVKGSTWKSNFQVADINNKKITISVLSDNEKKELYKYLNQ